MTSEFDIPSSDINRNDTMEHKKLGIVDTLRLVRSAQHMSRYAMDQLAIEQAAGDASPEEVAEIGRILTGVPIVEIDTFQIPYNTHEISDPQKRANLLNDYEDPKLDDQE